MKSGEGGRGECEESKTAEEKEVVHGVDNPSDGGEVLKSVRRLN